MRAVGLALFLLGGFALIGCNDERKPAAVDPPPPSVVVSKVIQREVQDFEEFIGRTAAVESVQLQARVSGELMKIGFKDGDEVKQGALLFEIDDRSFKADRDKAKAELTKSEANLVDKKAKYERNKPLRASRAISEEDWSQIDSDFKQAEALVTSNTATLSRQELNVGWCRVTAPISGRASRTKVTRGNQVQADTTLLTTIVSQDPMYVYVDADERAYLRIQELIRQGLLESALEAKKPMYLGLANEVGTPHEGYLDFVDNEVNPTTGTLSVRGLFKNPKLDAVPIKDSNGQITKDPPRLLTPGLFVTVRFPTSKKKPRILVSDRAIGSMQGQRYLLSVGDENVVVSHEITLGQLHDGLRVVESARPPLTPETRILTSGLQRAKPGIKVNPTEAAMPQATPVTNDEPKVTTPSKK